MVNSGVNYNQDKHTVRCSMTLMLLPIPNIELEVVLDTMKYYTVLEMEINNDKVEKEMDEDLANIIRTCC